MRNRATRFIMALSTAAVLAFGLIIPPSAAAQNLGNLTPLPASTIDLDAEIRVDTSDVTDEDIMNVQDEIKVMNESADPYGYFASLSANEQRAIIAAVERARVTDINPQVAPFATTQSDPYRIYIQGLEMLSCIALVDVVSCGIANQAATTASTEAQNRFPGATSLRNGKGDAFRHCSWNALMTMRIGADAAERIATNHETVAQGPADETSMDLYNNAQGRFLGSVFASSGDEASALNHFALWASIGLLSTLS